VVGYNRGTASEVTPTADEIAAEERIMAVRPTFVSDDRDSDHDARWNRPTCFISGAASYSLLQVCLSESAGAVQNSAVCTSDP